MKKLFSSFSRRFSRGLFLVLTVLLLPPGILAAGAAGQQRVAVLPFALNAPGQMDYLVAGIRGMLASRLAAAGGVLLVEPAAVDRALTQSAPGGRRADHVALAQRLGADYLIDGTLTAMGGGVSLDATVYAGEGGEPQRFFATAAKESEIIPAVDQLARDLGAKVFGQQLAPPAPGAGVPALPQAEQPAFTTAHPDRVQFGATPNRATPFVRPQGVASASGFTKSQNLPIGLRAMDAGDVDGDGQQEIVLAGANRIHIFRRDLHRLIPVGGASTLTRYVIHSVSLADVDKNGRAEIYVSAADAKGPRSLALEWDGQKFAPLFEDAEWYIRTVHLPGEGEVLAGQQAGLNDFLSPGLFRLGIAGHSLVKKSAIDLPDKLNLFDFTLVDVDADGTAEIVMINQDDHLVVMSRSGQRLWVSDDYYGGTTRYLGGIDLAEPGALEESLQTGEKRYYLPARIAARDIDRDGKIDIIVTKNISTASRVFSSYRSFPAGEVHALTWDGIGMTELWRTRKIDGYIADLQLGPDPAPAQTESGTAAGTELLVGVVLKSGGLNVLSSAESTVLMYPIGYEKTGSEIH